MTIEVEKRALLSKEMYDALLARLAKEAIDKGENDTESVFYLQPDAQIKVQRNDSVKTAKIAWKSGAMDGTEHRKELELTIDYDDFGTANKLMTALLDDAQVFPTRQTRHDYTLNGVDIAIKYSDDWGYHMELEVMVDATQAVPGALSRIEELAGTLGIQLLDEAEEKDFIDARIKEREAR